MPAEGASTENAGLQTTLGELSDDEQIIDDFVMDVESAEHEEVVQDRLPFFRRNEEDSTERGAVAVRHPKRRSRLSGNPFRESLKSRVFWCIRDHWRIWAYTALGALALSLVLLLLSRWSSGGERVPTDAPTDALSQKAQFMGHPYWHALLLRAPDPKRMRNLLHRLTSEPHMSGTHAAKRTAELIRDEWVAAGIPAQIETFQVLLGSQPSHLVIRWSETDPSAPETSIMDLTEPSIRGDAATEAVSNATTFHGYAASGKVRSAPIVYVNYGRPEDYAELDRRGINVSGKVVLVRYGQLFRGLKVFHAQVRQAAAVLIYSDPGDDGAARGSTYPDGPWRPAKAVQRGSVQFNALCVGDPSTPGYGSTEAAPRRTYEAAVRESCLPSIPSVPISAAGAEILFRRMHESWQRAGSKNDTLVSLMTAPEAFRGGLDSKLYVLSGNDDVRLDLEVVHEYALKPIYNVIGVIPGAHGDLESDKEIVFGNHHDAWIYGAVDPHTGTLVQMESVRAFGALLRRGWRPRRTLVFASWDAEEWGTIGSVEHVETNLESRIRGRTLVYVNADVIVSGSTARLGLAGSPLLTQAAEQAMRGLTDPITSKALVEDWKARRQQAIDSERALQRSSPNEAPHLGTDFRDEPPGPLHNRAATANWIPLLDLLGGGSDHTAFLHHAGVSSLDIGFDELDHPSYPVYHSIYDDEAYFLGFTDPDFRLHLVATQLVSTLLLDLVDAPLLPMNVTDYAHWLRYHLRLLETSRPDLLSVVQQQLQPAMDAFAGAAQRFSAQRMLMVAQCWALRECRAALSDRASRRLLDRDVAKYAALNQALMNVERALIHSDGIPGRSWYRHTAVAPHPDKGYSAVAFPFLYGSTATNASQGLAATAAAIQRAARVLEECVSQWLTS